MHSIISRKFSKNSRLNMLTPENLQRFEEEKKDRNKTIDFQSINYEDVNVHHPRSGNKCKR